MGSYRFVQLDVFTREPFAGNPLAVFPEAEGLSDEEMMAAAADPAALKSEIGPWVGTEVGTAFEQLGRRFKDLEKNRDYLPERERGEIMRALGECPLAAHARAEG